MIKKRSRPQPRIREASSESDNEPNAGQDGEDQLAIADLLEVRRLRKARQGIDAVKLTKGDTKRKKIYDEGISGPPGLRPGAATSDNEDEQIENERLKKTIRTTNFTQQTNVLDVDKHMMAYIEENLKVRSRPKEEPKAKPADPQEALYKITDRWKQDKPVEEGNVTNSLSMLTAIPEVDLGMDTKLKNIEETEKAKRVVKAEKQDRPQVKDDEAHLVATRFYRPNLKHKSDEDIIREAKLEAMGMPPEAFNDHRQYRRNDKTQLSTDEAVMERFKKRMRKG